MSGGVVRPTGSIGGALTRKTIRRSIGAVIGLAVLPAVALVTPVSGVSEASGRTLSPVGSFIAVGGVPGRPFGARRIGSLADAQVISLGVALRPRDPGALRALAEAVSTPHSPQYHRYLTPKSFAAEFGPSPAATAAVEKALRGARLRVGTASANGLIVPVSGTVGEIDAAFHTHLVAYRLAGGERGWAPAQSPRLPRNVAHAVSAVLGLDNLVVAHSMMERPRVGRPGAWAGTGEPRANGRAQTSPEACATAAESAQDEKGWTEDELAKAYGLTGLYAAGDLGAGQTIGVLELEPFDRSDIATFDRCFFGPGHSTVIRTIRIGGFDLHGPGTGEAVLDLETLAALAPEARLDVYDAPNTSFGPIDGYNAMVSADQANILSTSWGECETSLQISAPGTQQVENSIFEEAAAQGQTVFASSGDTGSDDCAGTQFTSSKPEPPHLSVDDPASQPYVVGVGGTSLRSDAPPLGPNDEVVWNDGSSGGGTGGGESNTWASPVWQAQSGVPGTAGAVKRLVPDVSSAADEDRGVTFYSASFQPSSSFPSSTSGWTTIGGTSVATPTWAAIIADIASSNGACATLSTTPGGHDLGFVAPELYAVAASDYATSFHNITIGDNDVFGLGLGYSAGPGFNLASGLGSPIVTDPNGGGGLASGLCAIATSSAGPVPAPVVSGITPDSGPTSGGNVVTLTGSGFATPGTTVHVEFGTSEARVDTVTDTSLAVTAPLPTIPSGGTTASAAGAVEVSVTVTSAAGEATSRGTLASLYDYVAENGSNASGPSVAAIGPPAGNVHGGRSVTIWGSGFAAAGVPSVSFGGLASPRVALVHDYELRARVPAESAATACARGPRFEPTTVCQVEVVVRTSRGVSATRRILPTQSGRVVFDPQGVIRPVAGTEEIPAATEYDYVPTPQVTVVAVGRSATQPVRIFGSGFSVLTFDWVNLGPASSVSSEQTEVDYVSPTSIVVTPTSVQATGATAAPFSGGVSVQTAGGLSDAAALPGTGALIVRQLSVLGGATAGGTVLRITGTGLAAVRSVVFVGELSPGLATATGPAVTDVTDGALTVRTPAHTAGPVDVLPCSATACGLARSGVDTFVFVPPSTRPLVALSPAVGPAAGGTEVTLFGRNVADASAAVFGPAISGPTARAPGYPPGDPYIAEVHSPPGRAGTRVAVTTVVPGRAASPPPGAWFRYRPSPPSAPRSVAVSRVGTAVVLRWQTPASDGGSRITSYRVVSTFGEAARGWRFGPRTRAVRLTGFVPRRSYRFVVTAWNAPHGRGLPGVVTAAPEAG
ncbi:MAG: protease pro-enzyme activation domain-containing protein [Acidimicrobiales bacterium]|jgi:hypothetical protein